VSGLSATTALALAPPADVPTAIRCETASVNPSLGAARPESALRAATTSSDNSIAVGLAGTWAPQRMELQGADPARPQVRQPVQCGDLAGRPDPRSPGRRSSERCRSRPVANRPPSTGAGGTCRAAASGRRKAAPARWWAWSWAPARRRCSPMHARTRRRRSPTARPAPPRQPREPQHRTSNHVDQLVRHQRARPGCEPLVRTRARVRGDFCLARSICIGETVTGGARASSQSVRPRARTTATPS